MSTASGENPWAGQGSVMLDIGGDVGALVVTMPAAQVGGEVEVAPVRQVHSHDGHDHAHDHEHPHRPHVAVVDRPAVGPTLVFPELHQGAYALYAKGSDEVRLTVEIVGGAVTTADWPDVVGPG